MVRFYINRQEHTLNGMRPRTKSKSYWAWGWQSKNEWVVLVHNFTCRECKARPGGHLVVENACDRHAAIMTLIAMDPSIAFEKGDYDSANWWRWNDPIQNWNDTTARKQETVRRRKMQYYDKNTYGPARAEALKLLESVERAREKKLESVIEKIDEITILERPADKKKKKKK